MTPKNQRLAGGCVLCLALLLAARGRAADDKPVPVTVHNFIRAETDVYFGKAVAGSGFGKLRHARQMTPVDRQAVVRMNRDTLYSSGVFDLQAAPVTITLPEVGKRFMSMQVLSQDHDTIDVVYAPGRFTYTQPQVGTRYAYVIVRTLADPHNARDMTAAHELQDKIQVAQSSAGKFEVPRWDSASQKKVRDALVVLGTLTGGEGGKMFGTKSEVDPVMHLIGTATGWGGSPRFAAVYETVFPKDNDGKQAYTLTVKDVPVDGFWSVSVYNAQGFFEKNDADAYSLNNMTSKPNRDGSFTIKFGGDRKDAVNHLPIMPGWNYTVRMFRPRKEILDGTWKFPAAQLLKQ